MNTQPNYAQIEAKYHLVNNMIKHKKLGDFNINDLWYNFNNRQFYRNVLDDIQYLKGHTWYNLTENDKFDQECTHNVFSIYHEYEKISNIVEVEFGDSGEYANIGSFYVNMDNYKDVPKEELRREILLDNIDEIAKLDIYFKYVTTKKDLGF